MPRLSLSQLVNLTLATFLLLGIAATTFTVTNMTGFNADAARRVKTATITLNQTEPHFGDTINFTTTGGGRYVQLVCYQTLAAIVYNQTQAVGTSFVLTPSSLYGEVYNPEWGGDCVAYLKNQTNKPDFLAITGFTAELPR
jgi:hypothetical protein